MQKEKFEAYHMEPAAPENLCTICKEFCWLSLNIWYDRNRHSARNVESLYKFGKPFIVVLFDRLWGARRFGAPTTTQLMWKC